MLQYKSSLKQCKPGKLVPNLVLRQYSLDKRLCVVDTLKEYVKRTKSLRGDVSDLFISYLKPYGAVTSSTISRIENGLL